MVALREEEKRDMVLMGEASYFSGLFVNDNGVLQLSNPNLKAKDMEPSCSCCIHTFNGKVFGTE